MGSFSWWHWLILGLFIFVAVKAIKILSMYWNKSTSWKIKISSSIIVLIITYGIYQQFFDTAKTYPLYVKQNFINYCMTSNAHTASYCQCSFYIISNKIDFKTFEKAENDISIGIDTQEAKLINNLIIESKEQCE